MNPKIEDVLFLHKKCKHKIENDNKVFYKKTTDKVCPNVKTTQETLENMVKEELKDKYYPGFVKFFKVNSEECELKRVKKAQKSVEARIEGNALLAKKEHDVDVHEKIWKLYSNSVATAPCKSKELLLAYESRSNFLLHLKKYEDCIKDVDRALSLTEFDLLKVKLLCRKMTCLTAMNRDVVEKEDLWKTLEYHFDKINSVFKDDKFLNMIEQAKNDMCTKPDDKIKDELKNFALLSSSSSSTLIHNKERRIIADRDYGAGETFIVTKPKVVSVNPDKFFAYCSHCLSFMWAGIPCDECSVCMYCSEECKKTAWEKYHILECKVTPHINFSYSIYYALATNIKIFCMGIREFGSVPKLLEKIREAEQLLNDPNFMKCDKFFESEFLNFYTLPNMAFNSVCVLSEYVKNTCFLMAYLTQTLGDIFGNEVIGSMKGKELAKNADFIYCTVVLLKIEMLCALYMDYPVMKEALECHQYTNLNTCLFNRCCPIGTIFHYHKGLLEKSCNPNVSICRTIDGKIIYYCTQPINKMEMITITRTVPFYKCHREERDSLKGSFPDFCKCVACEKNWPPVLGEYKKYRALFMRRTSKLQTKASQIFAKQIHKLELRGVENCMAFTEDDFKDLATDTNEVVNSSPQPSFVSSWLISVLGRAFEYLYGDSRMQMHIPKSC